MLKVYMGELFRGLWTCQYTLPAPALTFAISTVCGSSHPWSSGALFGMLKKLI